MAKLPGFPVSVDKNSLEFSRWLYDLWYFLDTNIKTGAGAPEGSVAANAGTLYLRSDGGASTTLYVKESGTGNTGWIAK